MTKAFDTYEQKISRRMYQRDYKPYDYARGDDTFGMSFYGTHRKVCGGIKFDTESKTLYYQGNAAGLWHTLTTDMTVEEMIEFVDVLLLSIQHMQEVDGTK